MHVLVVPSWYPSEKHPHVGTFFNEQARLAAEVFDVRVFVCEHSFVGRRKAIRWFVRRLMGPKFVWADRIGDGVPVYLLQAEAAWSRRRNELNVCSQLIDWFVSRIEAENWRPDLIHAQSALPGGILARAISDRLGVPYVITEHQHIIFDYFTNESWLAARHVYSQAARVAAVSEFERQMMLANGVTSNPTVIGNLVDDEEFNLRLGAVRARRILFVGTTSRLKDHGTFLAALQELMQNGIAFSAKIVSPEFQAGDFLRLVDDVQSLGLERCVELVKFANRKELRALIHDCDVLVSTSIVETFGVAVCEALMCGCPVVATRSGGVQDFVEDGHNGFLVGIGNHSMLSRRIVDVFDDKLPATPELIRKSVIGKFGRKAFLERLSAFYRDAKL